MISEQNQSWLRLHNQTILTLLLLLAIIWSFLSAAWGESLVHDGAFSNVLDLMWGMVTPELSPTLIWLGVRACLKTLAYAAAGIGLAIVMAVPLGILASGTPFSHPILAWASTGIFRGLLSLLRSVHELVWAWLFVASIGLSPLSAVLALAIPYSGILGRIWADIINDVRDEPLNSLVRSGGSTLQVLLMGRIPQAFPDLVSYTMFRFECAIRSAAVLSFVGLGGIGHQIELSLEDLYFHEAWTFIYLLIGLVVAISIWSSEVRRAMVHESE